MNRDKFVNEVNANAKMVDLFNVMLLNMYQIGKDYDLDHDTTIELIRTLVTEGMTEFVLDQLVEECDFTFPDVPGNMK